MHTRRRRPISVGFLLASLIFASAHRLSAQAAAPSPPNQPPLPPATKLEGFKPAAGSVVTFGYNNLGEIGNILEGASVDVREMRDAQGNLVRGLVVEVRESQYRRERSFVDADEIPELLKALDALLGVSTNPTSFENFEVRYTTRGEMRLTAYNSRRGEIRYAVQAGRLVAAQQTDLKAEDMRRLRAMFQGAFDKLNSAGTLR